MGRKSSSRLAICEISQIVKTRQIARQWHKLAAIPTAITGIKHALSMKISYYYDEGEEDEMMLSSSSDSISGGVPSDVLEGHLPVYAGKEEKLERFVIPVAYLSHPLFSKLLGNAEEEFAFYYRSGGLTLPCDPSVLAHIIHLFNHVPHHHDRLYLKNAATCSSSAASWALPASLSLSQATNYNNVGIKGKSVAVH